jgi:coenzyme F420-reducing hydrogenase alpha subunit
MGKEAIMKSRIIKSDAFTRVEGEGSLQIRIDKGSVTDVKLKIFEPPRFFEAFLRGRSYEEAPDITARICGICPVAYQMTALHAIEQAFDVSVDSSRRALRRLMYCGEWIESHALHIYMLHAPDFLGYPDAIAMSRKFPEAVQRGLRLKKVGNEILRLLGGREIHPINLRPGGFYRLPSKKDLLTLVESLQWAIDAARQTVDWVAGFPFPEFEQDYEFVSLTHPTQYPIEEGRIISSDGLDISATEYERYFEERQVSHSTSLHSFRYDRPSYLLGPLSRFNLNFSRLSESVREAARAAGVVPVCRNPFRSIIVRSLEVLYACEEALRIVQCYEEPSVASAKIVPRKAIGCACTEAPRGLLFHRYEFDEQGMILHAKIVPPTSQNQGQIENDLRNLVSLLLDQPEETLLQRCEQAVRNYDPCISCATHFLKLEMSKQ